MASSPAAARSNALEGVAALVPRPCGPEDARELVELFRRCFAPVRDTFQPRSLRRWAWKYRYVTGGSESMACRDPWSGRIVAHCGGIPYAVRTRDGVRRSVQALDHMVDPELRRGLHRGRLFVDLMDAWIEAYCSSERSFLGWGFPARCDFRLGNRYLGYRELAPVEVLVREARASVCGLPLGWAVDARARATDSELARLWRSCCAHFPMSLERDPPYLKWRYGEHPSRAHHLRALRDAKGELRAWIAMREGGLDAATLLILECLVPDDDLEAADAVREHATSFALEQGLATLAIWIAPWRVSYDSWRRCGFRAHRSALRHTARSWDPRVSLDEIREGFAWSLGDVDFL